MRVELKDLQPFSLRNFKIDPIDKDRVASLKDSIAKNSFWGGVVLRKNSGGLEIIAGHHRVRAAIAAGVDTADLLVIDKNIDDKKAVRIYTMENALQRGTGGTALAGSVAAAVRLVALDVLRGTSGGTSRRSLETAQGQITTARGIGRDLIEDLLIDSEKEDEASGITTYTIKQQMVNLKASGEYANIIKSVHKELKDEGASAEVLGLAKAAEDAAAGIPETFDFVGVMKHLKVAGHVEAFRKLCNSAEGYLPFNQQAEAAAEIVRISKDKIRGVEELTAKFIREQFEGGLFEAKLVERKLDAQERAALLRKNWTEAAREYQDDAARGASNFLAAVQTLSQHAKKRPEGVTLLITGKLRSSLAKIKQATALLEKVI